MIVGFFITLFLTFIQFTFGWLPSGLVVPPSTASSILQLADPLSKVSWFLPVYQLVNIILLTVPIIFAVMVWKIIKFTLGLIRGANYINHHGGL